MRALEKRLAPFAVAVFALAGCGANPTGTPVAPNGALGTAAVRANGLAPKGAVRRNSAQESTLYNFLGAPDGGLADSALVVDGAGDFYGTTFTGGDLNCGESDYPGCGTIFKLTPSPSGGYTESVVWTFEQGQGVNPVSVIVDASGNLYGVTQHTSQDGDAGGTVFKLTPGPSGYSFTLLHTFTGGTDGAYPAGTLALDKGGDVYGTTLYGGNGSCVGFEFPSGCGTAFEVTLSKGTYTYKQIHAFQGGTDGAFPTGAILYSQLQDAVIGTTAGYVDGEPSQSTGNVYALTAENNGSFFNQVRYSFGRGVDFPYGGVIQDAQGDLFGTAIGGGSHAGLGGVYELKPYKRTYKFSVLYTFKSAAKTGAYPSSGVIEDSHGNLFGTTPIDHQSHFSPGTVFELSPVGKKYAYTELYDFPTEVGGFDPNAVTLGPDGNLYGTTFQGGSTYQNSLNGYGVVFEIAL